MNRVLLCGAVLAFASADSVMSARAQTPPNYSSLANAITGTKDPSNPLPGSFFTSDGANAGNDWCYEVEADPNETVWSFAANDGWSYPHLIDYAVRIRLAFPAVIALDPKNPTNLTPVNDAGGNRVMDTASLFMGFDLMKNQSYNSNDISIVKQENIIRKPKYTPPTSVAPVGLVNIPGTLPPTAASPSICPTFSSMLGTIFARYLSGWELPPGSKPECDDLMDNCPYINLPNPVDGKATTYISRQTSVDNTLIFSTWTFNGQTHKIPRAIRFLVKYNGAAAYFTIGFGGSGGAG